MQTLEAGTRSGGRGFTLLELLVVVAIMAIAAATISLALRDPAAAQLAREGERLAALFESARAQSRAAGVPVIWHTTPSGFAFEGLPASAAPLPTQWLDGQTSAPGNAPVVLGPDPIIGAQSVVLQRPGAELTQLVVATDGLRPFTVERP